MVKSQNVNAVEKKAKKPLANQHKAPPKSAQNKSNQLFSELGVYELELEKQLQLAEYNYQELYEFAPCGYFTLDEGTIIAEVNLCGAQMLGVPRRHLLQKPFLRFINRIYHALFHSHCQLVATMRSQQSCELELLKADGASFFVQLESDNRPNRLTGKNQLRITVINIDEYRRTEQALRASEEKFRSFIDTTKEWIWAIDPKGRFLYSNPAVEHILGYASYEILGHARLMLIHKEDRPQAIQALNPPAKNKQGWNELVLRWRCKDGSYRYLESNAVAIVDQDGHPQGFRGSDRDITLRKQAEEQARLHQAALEQATKMSSLGEFASALAHELTQPLTAINNFITGCIKRLDCQHEANCFIIDVLQQAAHQAERAGAIIHRMKDFARRKQLHYEKINICATIREAIISIKKEFPESNVQIHFEVENSHACIMADKIQIEQVMINLLRNAIEVLRSHYTLTNPQIWIQCVNYPDDYVTISVADNGPGLYPEHNIERLFEACFTTKAKGLGMGLAICRTIVEAHKGQLTAHNSPLHKGACFQFTLPINHEKDG